MSEPTKCVPIDVVAKRLSLSPSTVRNCMKDGRIPSYTYFKIGKNYRLDLETIIALFRQDNLAPQQSEPKQEVIETVEKVSEKPLQEPPSPQLEFDFDADLDI